MKYANHLTKNEKKLILYANQTILPQICNTKKVMRHTNQLQFREEK